MTRLEMIQEVLKKSGPGSLFAIRARISRRWKVTLSTEQLLYAIQGTDVGFDTKTQKYFLQKPERHFLVR